jgi:hypothetical protein
VAFKLILAGLGFISEQTFFNAEPFIPFFEVFYRTCTLIAFVRTLSPLTEVRAPEVKTSILLTPIGTARVIARILLAIRIVTQVLIWDTIWAQLFIAISNHELMVFPAGFTFLKLVRRVFFR